MAKKGIDFLSILEDTLEQDDSSDLELIQKTDYHGASLLHRAPSRLLPITKASNKHTIPISAQEGNLILYRKVFIHSDSQPSLKVMRRPRKSKNPKNFELPKQTKSQLGFFYQLLCLATEYPNPQESLQDLLYKSKFGVAPGDVGKEAKISLAIGDMFEANKEAGKAMKFYRKLYFASEISEDFEGKALALNRLGLVFYNTGKFRSSLQMHKMHKDLEPEEFIAYYNLAISYRMLGYHKSCLKVLKEALALAKVDKNSEGICICSAQMGLTYKILNMLDMAKKFFNKSVEEAQRLGIRDIETEVRMALAYVYVFDQEHELAEREFFDVLLHTRGHRHEVCRINIGILRTQMSSK